VIGEQRASIGSEAPTGAAATASRAALCCAARDLARWVGCPVGRLAYDAGRRPWLVTRYTRRVHEPTPRPSPRRITGRLVRPGEDAEAFDREFWRSMTGEERVEALWQMTLDAIAVMGGNPHEEPRLQKSVGRIIRP
jgi:hypothetical protein